MNVLWEARAAGSKSIWLLLLALLANGWADRHRHYTDAPTTNDTLVVPLPPMLSVATFLAPFT
jgi:hypothetical protein